MSPGADGPNPGGWKKSGCLEIGEKRKLPTQSRNFNKGSGSEPKKKRGFSTKKKLLDKSSLLAIRMEAQETRTATTTGES